MKMTRIGFIFCAFALGSWTVGCASSPNANVEHPSAPGQSSLEQAEALERAGDYVRAEQYLNAALSAGAAEDRILPRQVRVCIADHRYRDAEQYLEEYLRRHPSKQGARFLLATVHLSLGHNELARRELTRVLRDDPNQADAHFALATLLQEQGLDYAKADAHFRAYLALEPEGSHSEEARGALLTVVP